MTTSTTLNFTEAYRNGALILELSGAIDGPFALEPATEVAISSQAAHVIVVISGVDYINSAGFGALIRLSDAVTEKKKGLFIVGLQSKVHVVFQILGASSVLNVLPTLNDALARIQALAK